jgi:hypothetical protein
MTEIHNVARQIQQIEIYLNSLVSALIRGELPVNLQHVTQIFDNTIVAIPPILNLSEDRFIEIHNDLPQLLSAYAINVTLSEDSYHQATEIFFHRLSQGNYWVIPTQLIQNGGWLIPNPLKNLALDRMKSLEFSFDIDIFPTEVNQSNYFLVTPALVKILPIAKPLTWKLIQRGKLTNTQIDRSISVNENLYELVKKTDDRAKYHIAKLSDSLIRFEDQFTKQDREIANLKIQLALLTITDSPETNNVCRENNFLTTNSEITYEMILSDYCHNSREFATKYQVKTVNLTEDCINANRGSEKKNVILEEKKRGNYWIFDFGDNTYLVPIEDKYINRHSYTTTTAIFAGHNYTPDYQKIQLVKPAIVLMNPNTNPQTWRLQEQGELAFL